MKIVNSASTNAPPRKCPSLSTQSFCALKLHRVYMGIDVSYMTVRTRNQGGRRVLTKAAT